MSYIAILLNIDTQTCEQWTAVGTIGLAIISFIAIVVQIIWNRKILKEANKNSQSQLDLLDTQLRSENENSFKYTSVKLAENFEKKFDNLANERKNIAKIIIENKLLDQRSLDYSTLEKKLDNIYDLFDTIGYFVKNKYVKPAVVHQYFDYWFSRYYEFYVFYDIKKLAQFEDTIWNNLAKLSESMDLIEIEQHGKGREAIDKKELERFFKEEQYL